jgi:hypothetical protein
MATVLEEYRTEEQRAVMPFLCAKGLNSNDIDKETFPIYGKKCLPRKAVHIWVETFSQGRSKVADNDRPGRLVEITNDRSNCTASVRVESSRQEDNQIRCSSFRGKQNDMCMTVRRKPMFLSRNTRL